jgi:hypothetical protein
MPYKQFPVIKAFIHDPDSPNSRYVTEFHELLKKANQANGSHKKYAGDEKMRLIGRNNIEIRRLSKEFVLERARGRHRTESQLEQTR